MSYPDGRHLKYRFLSSGEKIVVQILEISIELYDTVLLIKYCKNYAKSAQMSQSLAHGIVWSVYLQDAAFKL